MKRIILAVILVSTFTIAFSQGLITNMSAAEFKKAIENRNVQLVDVRTPEEYATGHIAGAILLDFHNNDSFLKGIEKLRKDMPVALYCKSGRRSANAARIFSEKGYTVINLNGGITEWNSALLPTIK